jgi:linoleoyl-CoA desaturase
MYSIRFGKPKDKFFSVLQQEVNDYFKKNNIKPNGNIKLYLKTIILIPSAVVIYLTLLFAGLSPVFGILLSGLLGFVLASIGFNVMHDACHGSYSTKSWVNNLLGLTLNALGGNAFIWKQKHNVQHHTYTNVDGVDDDIAKAPFMRQCTSQKRLPIHKFQHIFVFGFYALSSFLWVFAMDFVKYFTNKIVNTELMKMSISEHAIFWVSKFLYLVFYIIVPIYFVGFTPWLVGFAAFHIMMGLTLAIVFQLAHVVEGMEFTDASNVSVIENDWAVHQMKTTTDFAPDNKIISWFVGGLNFQVEHHLFPRVSHVHYPAIHKILKKVAAEYDVPYHCFPTMSSAIASHVRFMKALGQSDELEVKPSFQ